MTNFTRMAKQQKQEFTAEQIKGITLIFGLCLMVAAFFAGMSIGMMIQEKHAKRSIRNMHYEEHYAMRQGGK